MNLHSIVALACTFLMAGTARAQQITDSQKNVYVQLETLELNNGLPGAEGISVVGVGGSFGTDTTTERDRFGKLLYVRNIKGESRWLAHNVIEVKFNITENGVRRTERIRVKNFEPNVLVLREDRSRAWRELLRIIPVFKLDQSSPGISG